MSNGFVNIYWTNVRNLLEILKIRQILFIYMFSIYLSYLFDIYCEMHYIISIIKNEEYVV